MSEKNVASAQAYYKSMAAKDLMGMSKHLHPDVRLIAPISQLQGKDAVLQAAERLMGMLNSITFRASFGLGDQVMLAYDWDCAPPIGKFPAAVLIDFKGELISKIELFFDARPFAT